MEDRVIAASSRLLAIDLKPSLEECGYSGPCLIKDYRFDHQAVLLAGFAHQPTDARSACIAVLDSDGDSSKAVANCRDLGAPVTLVCHEARLEWWKQTRTQPELQETLTRRQLDGFFKAHREEFKPDRIYRAKTFGRFQSDEQLHFVDVGLMPLVEDEMGERLSRLMVRVVSDIVHDLKHPDIGVGVLSQVFKSVFWMLAAKILHDKRVENFKRIDLLDVREVFSRVGRHYADTEDLPPNGRRWEAALDRAASSISEFAPLANVSTEALGYLYEATFVEKNLRKELGTHSTPSYLVDYMLWQLASWIEEIPEQDRYVFEPACGHAAFLVSAMRMLRFLARRDDSQTQHEYLKGHLCGVEKDSFALEIARLSLTLADIPNPNGWRLIETDMFESDVLTREAGKARILLANPPFERFTSEEKLRYRQAGFEATRSKAAEMLARTLPHLPHKAAFGVVVPQGFLHSREALDIRRQLVAEFEVSEMCLFPDKVFAFSDMETAILLGRRKPPRAVAKTRYRRVREKGMQRFRESYGADLDRVVPQARFELSEQKAFWIPELEHIWHSLSRCQALGDLADVRKGLDYKGKDLPKSAWTIHKKRARGDVAGFANVPRDLNIYGQPPEVGMNLDPTVLLSVRAGLPPKRSQVLIGYAPVSRGPWRLKAVLDTKGHAVTSRWMSVRPSDLDLPIEYVWAVLNSPMGNAYAYCHSMKRDILVGTMRRMPVPSADSVDIRRVIDAAQGYLAVVKQRVPFMEVEPDQESIREALLRMDAEVLRLYNLPPRLERQLLDLFAREERKGAGCKFDRYFPPDFKPFVPLHEYISEEYRRSTAGEMRKRYRAVRSPAVLEALERAVEAFQEE